MSEPTHHDLAQLKRAVRYFKGANRYVQQFRQQDVPERIRVCTDSDFAGCLRTRRSTSCCMVFWGQHLVRSSSTTQAVVSLSSGEAEFYSAVKGASIGLGTESLMKDMGVRAAKTPLLQVDSSACLGMAGRRGAGRVRHIHTPCLWIQRSVAEGRLELEKIPGSTNPADLGTKPLAKASIQRIMEIIGFRLLAGRSKLALRSAGSGS